MNTYYLIDNVKYMDSFMLSRNLGVTRHTVRGLLKEYRAEVIKLQNKRVYPVSALVVFAKNQIKRYGEKTADAQ